MSAKISYTYACPRCGEGIVSINNTTECPSCKLLLGDKTTKPYEYPYTLCEQHFKYRDTELLLSRIREMDIKKAISILTDGFHIMEFIGDKKGETNDIRILIDFAIHTGEIAKNYLSFLDAGGKHMPDPNNTTTIKIKGDYHESVPPHGAREETSTREPKMFESPEQPSF